MRVLHFIPSLGPGGAERQLSLLAPALKKNGAECAIAYNEGGPNLAPILKTGVVLHQLPTRGTHDVRRFFDMLAFAKRWQPDVIQTWLTQMDVIGAGVSGVLGIPHFLSERSSRLAYPTGWKTSLRVFAGRHASAIVANSKAGAEYWREQSVSCPISVISNVLSPSRHDPSPADEQPLGRFIIFAGRLSFEKNLPNLIRGITKALDTQRDCHALLFGEGPMRTEVADIIAASAHHERIQMRGYSESLGGWMAKASALVAVSDFEGHPNVIIEAAAAGCPLILSDIPAHREIFASSEAQFVDGHDPFDIARGILHVLNNSQKAQQMAKSAASVLNDCQIDTQISKYMQLYQSAISR